MFRILDKVYLGKAAPAAGGGGITPTGTISITQNGAYDVTNYASADVNVASTTGDYTVYVYDYDGELLQAIKGNANDVIDLPATTPTHEGLEFTNWCATAPISNNQITLTDSDVYVAAFYRTTSGNNEFFIELNESSGLDVAVNRLNSLTEINWGDGTTSASDTHTYADYGTYKISTYYLDSLSSFFKSSFKGMLREVRLSSYQERVPSEFCDGQKTLEKISLPYRSDLETFTIKTSAFRGACPKIIPIPANYVLESYAYSGDYSIKAMFFEYGSTGASQSAVTPSPCDACSADVVWYPDTMTDMVSISNGKIFKTNRRFKNIVRIHNMTFDSLTQEELIFDKPLTDIAGGVYSLGDSRLKKLKTKGISNYYNASAQNLNYIESIDIDASSDGPYWRYANLYRLKQLKMPKLVKYGNMGPSVLNLSNTRVMEDLDLTSLDKTTTLNQYTIGMNPACVIKITFDQYGTFTTATNWSALKSHYKVVDPAEITFDVTPSNCTILTNDGDVVNNQIEWKLPSMIYLVHNEQNGVYVYKTRTGISANDVLTITEDTTSGYTTVTINLGYDDVNAIYKIGDYTISPVSTGNTGEYQFKLKLDETTNISYAINDDNYMSAAGTITVVPGTDSSETITLTPATTTQYVRPNLTANGTWGSGELAVKAYSNNADAWKAVDGTTTTQWMTSIGSYYTYSMYFGTTISMSAIAFDTASSYRPGSIKLEVSSDDTTYIEVPVSGPVLSGNSSVYSIITPMANQYNYYRITFLTVGQGSYSSVRPREILITAVHKEPL